MTHANLNYVADWSSVDVRNCLQVPAWTYDPRYITYITAIYKILHRNNIIVISTNRSHPGRSYFRSMQSDHPFVNAIEPSNLM